MGFSLFSRTVESRVNVGHFLQLALDPSRLLRERGIEADGWQRALLRCPARHILLNCSRQSGKSTTVAALALQTALFEAGSLTLLLSPTLRQSGELFRKLRELLAALPDLPPPLHATQTHLELAHGSRIVSLPGKEATVRSFSGVALLIIDEAARVPDDLYRSVRPMLAVSQGRLVCLSTPFGKRGFFWREWEGLKSADDDGPPADWHRVRIPWRDCPRITPAFIDNERRSLGDAWVRQEYECSFEALEGLVYPDFDAQSGIDAWPAPEGRAVGGIDFGFRNPFCALWGVLDRDDVLWLGQERYLREVPIHEHAAALPRGVSWFADPAGRTETEELRHAGLTVRRGDNDIRAGIAAVTARLRTGRLRVSRPGCPNLLAEAKLYRYDGAGELPVDAHNHALGALRYLVSKIDAGYFARLRRPATAPPPAPPSSEDTWLRRDNAELW